jgi:hypothetical protein
MWKLVARFGSFADRDLAAKKGFATVIMESSEKLDDQLQRAPPPGGELLGLIHGAHPALAELPHDAVVHREHLPGLELDQPRHAGRVSQVTPPGRTLRASSVGGRCTPAQAGASCT